MKGNTQVIEALQGILLDELTAVHQYGVHLGMALNWGYDKFAAYLTERKDDEEKHVANIEARILLLGGNPDASKVNPIRIGADIPNGLANDLAAEVTAHEKYTDAINLCMTVGDEATRDVLRANLKDEDDHIKDIEARTRQIKDMTAANWLSTQN